jgi:hypothetical protein
MPSLPKKCNAERSNTIVDFMKWLVDVRCLDEGIHSDCLEPETTMKNNHDLNHCNNSLVEPSHHSNIPNTATAFSSTANPSNAATSSSTPRYAPCLTELEHQLLMDNESCFKCWKLFADHQSKNCPNNFPNGVRYCPLTQSDVDCASAKHNQNTCTTAAVLPENKNVSTTTVHPVAAVLGSSQQPVAYMPTNASSVLEANDNDLSMSSTSVSNFNVATAITCSILSTTAPKADTVPFCVPHLFWRCSISGASESFPLTFNALIDNGSHTVLIHEELVNTLCLHHCLLPELENVELVMQTGKKKIIVKLTEYVKLQLYDPNC